MGRVERGREIARRRARRIKLGKLRLKYAKATSRADKELIVGKVRKVSPFAVLEESAAT
jgi:hypothetical protein